MQNPPVVQVRPAIESDFEWVAELMHNSLSPFYDGDHRAHAERIFTTHIAGGLDYVGHFSAEQHMFVATVDGVPAGLVHLVVKKQSTVKISPLIVDPNFRGTAGIGGTLLNHAIDFAQKRGARQLYGTVASTNKLALGFFTKKGFTITGTAPSHYKQGVDEHMVYLSLAPDSDLNAPNISVVEFDREQHEEGVREIILESLPLNFEGVDDSWVDALFRGYDRMSSSDINTKYKIIYVAESGGKVVGVAGATPKKGQPIKLMPLVAEDEYAFEALIIDLQSLLIEYGHKLYVHLVPEAWQIECLQRHGWSIEGVFRAGYSATSVVQQWGINLRRDVFVKQLRIKGPYLDAIKNGVKTLEVRVGYKNITKIKTGDMIMLESSMSSVKVVVKDIRIYSSIEEMMDVESWKAIMPDATGKPHALQRLREIYPAAKERLGMYVFEIEPLK